MLEQGEVFAGYRIDAVAGRGGMGVVYRATHLELERTVALKLIVEELAEEHGFRTRFRRETRLLASIDHPHVIPVYEAGDAEGSLFVSMRWVDGVDLGEVLRTSAGLDPQRAVTIVQQVADALDTAHRHRLVHRDVKPANVLIERREHGEHAFLSDFGIGKLIDAPDDVTAPGQWVGTLDYMAPEQLLGRPSDARADVYALGCLLFETLIGRVPYHRESQMAVVSAHLHDPPPSTRRLRPDLPAGFDGVIARAMAKEPSQRYPTAGELARAVASAMQPERKGSARPARETVPEPGAQLDAEATPLRPETSGAAPPRRGRPWVRRLGAAGVAAVLGAVAVAIGVRTLTSPNEPPAPVPCTPAVRDLFDCPFYPAGDGITGGAPVVSSSGVLVGHLSKGDHRVICQSIGRREHYGPYFNHYWARTIAGNHRSGWVNAVYAKGGANDGRFGGVPSCATSYGPPPGGAPGS